MRGRESTDRFGRAWLNLGATLSRFYQKQKTTETAAAAMSHGIMAQYVIDLPLRRWIRRTACCRSLSALSKKRRAQFSDIKNTGTGSVPRRGLLYLAGTVHRINDLLNKLLYSSGLAGRTLFMTNLVHRDAGIAARLSFGAMRSFSLRAGPAEA